MTQEINFWPQLFARTATAALLAGSCMLSTQAQAVTLSDFESRAQPDCGVEMRFGSINTLSPASGLQGAATTSQLKSNAILGGIPSKLEHMKMQQRAASPLIASARSRSITPLQIQVASHAFNVAVNYRATPCVTGSTSGQKNKLADVKTAVFPKQSGTQNIYSDDILGTAALPVRRTPLDQKWNTISAAKIRTQQALREYMSAAGINGHANKRQLVQRINQWVNATVTYTDDFRQTGTRDAWAPALQTLRSGKGDCEDYAIGKMQLLMAAGMREQDMQFVVVRDLVRRADHAILIVKLDGDMLLLDSNTNRIVDARQNHDYMPVFSFSGSKKWMHGHRYQPKTPPAVQLASR